MIAGRMKNGRFLKRAGLLLALLFLLHIVVLVLFYFFQEHVLFKQRSLDADYAFQFELPFTEIHIPVERDIKIHGLLFKSEFSKGIVLFFHGNGGTVKQWGRDAEFYRTNSYDVFFVDYRGYGKSDGHIQSEEQLISDAQAVYDYFKLTYSEKNMVIAGLSMGTGIAAQLAVNNAPNRLILMAPYTGLEDLIREKAIVVPKSIIRYKLRTITYLKDIACPIFVLHGKDDKLIPYSHAKKIKQRKESITILPLTDCGHMIVRCSEFDEALFQALKN